MEIIIIYYLLQLVRVYSFLLVLYALLSWFPGGYQSGLGRFLSKICDPYLSIFDRMNLNFGGMNFSILVAILFLNFMSNGIARILVSFGLYF